MPSSCSPPPAPAPAHSTHPTTLADLQYHLSSTTDTNQKSIYGTLRTLRRSQLSFSNRLRSIVCDSEYITSISSKYPDCPLIANERCGSWYIPPHLRPKAGPNSESVYESVYFKSTDGHQGHWKFSLRRLNLHLLHLLGQHGGAVVVDSTRKGKAMSDALRWTVPVWVAVVNRVCFPDRPRWQRLQGWFARGDCATQVESEQSVRRTMVQVEERLEKFVEDFQGLGVDVEELRRRLKRPIRVIWEVNGGDCGEVEDNEKYDGDGEKDTNLLVLCSASHRVTGAEMSEAGYVQGAADDSEGWSGGLTPDLFWKHHEELLSTPEDDLQTKVSRLVRDQTTDTCGATLIRPTTNIFIANDMNREPRQNFDLVVNCCRKGCTISPMVLNLDCPPGKAGSNALRKKLPLLKSHVAAMLRQQARSTILFTCSTGRDLSVGAALMVLCLFFDDTGRSDSSYQSQHHIDKMLVKRRLAWISSTKPDIQPSRSTLQAVNTVLMEPP